jgi:hypothetical protein
MGNASVLPTSMAVRRGCRVAVLRIDALVS